MAAELLVLVFLPAVLALAAGWDVASLTIPNFLSLALLVAFALFCLFTRLPAQMVVGHLLAGLLGLVVGFALFVPGFVAAEMPSSLPARWCGWGFTRRCNMRSPLRCSAADWQLSFSRCARCLCRKRRRACPGSRACMIPRAVSPTALRWRLAAP